MPKLEDLPLRPDEVQDPKQLRALLLKTFGMDGVLCLRKGSTPSFGIHVKWPRLMIMDLRKTQNPTHLVDPFRSQGNQGLWWRSVMASYFTMRPTLPSPVNVGTSPACCCGTCPDSKPQLLPTCLGALLAFMLGNGICNLSGSTLHLHLCRAVLLRFWKPSQPWSLVMRYGIAFGGIAR
jgi:hypothetical protein